MKSFRNIKATTVLLASLAAACVLVALVGYMGVRDMSRMDGMLNSLYSNQTMGISHIQEANTDMMAHRGIVRSLLLATSPQERKEELKDLAAFEMNLLAEINEAAPTIKSEGGKQLLAEFWPAWNTYKQIADSVVALSASRKADAIMLSNTAGTQAADAVNIIISRMAIYHEAGGWAAHLQSNSLYRSSRDLLVWLVIAFMAFAAAFALLLGRKIRRTGSAAGKPPASFAAGESGVSLRA